MEIKAILKEILDRFHVSQAGYLKIDLGWRKYIELEKKVDGIEVGASSGLARSVQEAGDSSASPQKGMALISLYVGRFKGIKGNLEGGAKVKRGEILGFIESMGITHEVVAPVNGQLIEVNVKDGDIVEYEQLLFKVKEEK